VYQVNFEKIFMRLPYNAVIVVVTLFYDSPDKRRYRLSFHGDNGGEVMIVNAITNEEDDSFRHNKRGDAGGCSRVKTETCLHAVQKETIVFTPKMRVFKEKPK